MTLQASAQKQLRQFVEQIERLEEEKRQISADIRDKYLEAKGVGFDVKIIRQVIKLRRKDKTEREEEQSILEVYLHALGMLGELADTPLGEAAMDRDFSKVKLDGPAAEAYRQKLAEADARGADMMRSPDGINIWPTSIVREVVGEPSEEQKAAARLKVMHEKDGGTGEPQISVNGGPMMPLSEGVAVLRENIDRKLGVTG